MSLTNQIHILQKEAHSAIRELNVGRENNCTCVATELSKLLPDRFPEKESQEKGKKKRKKCWFRTALTGSLSSFGLKDSLASGWLSAQEQWVWRCS